MAPCRRLARIAQRARAAAARNRSTLGAASLSAPTSTKTDAAAAFRQPHQEVRMVCEDARGRRRKGDRRSPHQAVQPLIVQADAVAGRLGVIGPAAFAARRSPHLEHVAEVGLEPQRQRDHGLAIAVVRQGQPLVHPVFPQQPRALDVDDALWRRLSFRRRQRKVGQIGREDDVVLAERSAEQRWRPVAEQQPEMRQHPGVVAKQAVAPAANVAIVVRDDEAIAMLQRKLSMRVARRGIVERRQRDGRVEFSFVEHCHASPVPAVEAQLFASDLTARGPDDAAARRA